MIFVSNFFIKKFNSAKHWYVDKTFVHPKIFSQLIIILYKDDKLNRRFPGLFVFLNDKNMRIIYICLKIYILTIEETIQLSLDSYTLDFEIVLQNAFSQLLPNKRCVGCYKNYIYYHLFIMIITKKYEKSKINIIVKMKIINTILRILKNNEIIILIKEH